MRKAKGRSTDQSRVATAGQRSFIKGKALDLKHLLSRYRCCLTCRVGLALIISDSNPAFRFFMECKFYVFTKHLFSFITFSPVTTRKHVEQRDLRLKTQ